MTDTNVTELRPSPAKGEGVRRKPKDFRGLPGSIDCRMIAPRQTRLFSACFLRRCADLLSRPGDAEILKLLA
jgi:hypothetical protein